MFLLPGLRLNLLCERSPLSGFASCCAKSLGVCVLLLSGAAAQTVESAQARAGKFLAERGVAAGSKASPAEALQRAHAEAARLGMLPRGASLTAAWTPLGPSSVGSASYGTVSGRVTAVAFDPTDATGNTVYLGTTGGGVWKSVNAAATPASAVTFAPLTDTLPVFSQSAGASVIPSLSMGAVAVQAVAVGTPVVMAGTGDPNDATDSLYGEGLLRSADGGATWTLVSVSQDGVNGQHAFAGLATAGIAWSGASGNTVVAAMSTSGEGTLEGATASTAVAGLYSSTDAGVTWSMATLYDGSQVVQTPEPAVLSVTGNAATSVVWDAVRGSFYAAVRGHGYYASADGQTWTRLSAQPGAELTTANCSVGVGGLGAATCPIFRGTLAVQPVTGDLYALTVDANDDDQGLWQDLCGAVSGVCATSAPVWGARVDAGEMEVGGGSAVIVQGSYNLSLAAVPAASSGGTVLLAGTVDVWRCAMSAGSSSCSLRNTTNALDGCNAPAGVAPAQHALAGVLLGAGPLAVIGNDGGLWRSVDGIAETGNACAATDEQHFDNLNAELGAGGSLAEVVGLAQSPGDGNTLMAGLGANGSAATVTASSLGAWPQLSAGEGGLPAIDQATPTNWYATIGAGVTVKACALGANCAAAANFVSPATVGEAQVAYDASLLDAPWMLDPGNAENLIVGTCRVWRGAAASGAAWSGNNAISAAMNGGGVPCGTTSALVRSVGAGGPVAVSSNAQSAGSEVIYAGMAGTLDGGTTQLGGHVFLTQAANTATNATAWTDVATSPVTNDVADAGVFNPDGFDVAAVVVDQHDTTGATVYATVAGFGSVHVYRSTDAGMHWLNVSSNLPVAPVNALVVDPNDANTVYVASDAGVYATRAVTTCATTQCWGLLGTGLPNAPVTALAAGAQLPTGDGRLGMLRAGTYGRGIWQTPLLAATTTAAPGMTLSASSLLFAAQQVATQSATQTLTVTSSGSSPLVLGKIAVTGDFSETDNCAGQTLAVSATCAVNVVFAPTATGTRTGTLTVFANVSGGQGVVALAGVGTAAASIVLTPVSLTFAATTVNQAAPSQVITVANTGGSAATLQAPVVSGDFAVSGNTCGATLAAGTACAVSVTFTPTAAGTRNGTLAITDSVGTQTATLTGVGNAPATDTLAPLSLSFAQTTVGATSAALQVTLTNSGDVALGLINAASSSSEFAVTNGCGASLAGHATCAISVVFAPAAVGTRTAMLSVSDQYQTQAVALTGVGVAPAGVSLSPASLSFGTVGVGLTSPAQAMTLTNNGGVPLLLTSVMAAGDFVIASTTCGATLAANTACTLTVVFHPTLPGVRSGSVVLSDNAASGTQSAALQGTGVDFVLAANGPTTATISGTNGSATFPLLLSSVSTVTTSAAIACSGAPAHTTCVVTPSSLALGSTVNVSAVVETGVTGAALGGSRDELPWMRAVVVFAVALPLVFVRRRRWMGLLGLLGLMVVLGGCGTGRVVPTDSGTGTAPTPTPTGTYNLTVAATSAGVTHSVGLTLVVQ
jgi:hypothetical protein